jgi:hypothetical protein
MNGAGEGGVAFGVWVNAIASIRFLSPRLIDFGSEWGRVEVGDAETGAQAAQLFGVRSDLVVTSLT